MESSSKLYVSCTIVVLFLLGYVESDLAKDREKCADKLVGLATCLPYVGGESKAPTADCCSGFKEVLAKSKECICILVKDRDDPSLGLKINATLALSLPSLCHAPLQGSNVTECINLLHLAPNSPDAKVFEDFAKGAKTSNPTPSPDVKGKPLNQATSASTKSDGGRSKSWLGHEMAYGLLLSLLLHTLNNH